MANGSCWPVTGIPSADINVSFLRNGNHFPDSGHILVAAQRSLADPERSYTDCLYRVPENFTISEIYFVF
jgi:hypothetical protein